MLTNDALRSLGERTDRGNKILATAWSYVPEDEDRESAAKDSISDILTALFGPAGKLTDDRRTGRAKVELDSEAVENASALMDAALQSYFGDAEDYVEVAEEETSSERRLVTFQYGVVTRAGYVIGVKPGRFGLNVEVMETWNSRDGEHPEPRYRLFASDRIFFAS